MVYRGLARRHNLDDPESAWQVVLVHPNGEGQTLRHMYFISTAGDFKIQFPPFNHWEELQAMLYTAARSICQILLAPLVDFDDYAGENMVYRFKKYICRGRLLTRIRVYRRNGLSDTTFLLWHKMFSWRADGWRCTFNASGENQVITWMPIYKSPLTSEDSSSDDDDDDDDRPGPSGQSRVQNQRSSGPQHHEDVDTGSSSQEEPSQLRKKNKGTNTGGSINNNCLDFSSSDEDRPGSSAQSEAQNLLSQSRIKRRFRRRGTQTNHTWFSASGFSTGHSLYNYSPDSWTCFMDEKGDNPSVGICPYYDSSTESEDSSESSSSEFSLSESSSSDSSSSDDDERPGPSGLSQAQSQQQHMDVDAGSSSHEEEGQSSLRKRRRENGHQNNALDSSSSEDDHRPGPSGLHRAQNQQCEEDQGRPSKRRRLEESDSD